MNHNKRSKRLQRLHRDVDKSIKQLKENRGNEDPAMYNIKLKNLKNMRKLAIKAQEWRE